jgi:hypothetical protein
MRMGGDSPEQAPQSARRAEDRRRLSVLSSALMACIMWDHAGREELIESSVLVAVCSDDFVLAPVRALGTLANTSPTSPSLR